MSESRLDRDSFLQGLLMGGLLGAVTALLFAPKSGKDLRTDIIRKGEEAVEGTKRLYEEGRAKAEVILNEATERAQQLRDEASRHLSEARQKAETILTRAEEKASEITDSAKGMVSDTKSEFGKKKDKVTKAMEAGVEAAKQEYAKK